jgi:hypothetical protein
LSAGRSSSAYVSQHDFRQGFGDETVSVSAQVNDVDEEILPPLKGLF